MTTTPRVDAPLRRRTSPLAPNVSSSRRLFSTIIASAEAGVVGFVPRIRATGLSSRPSQRSSRRGFAAHNRQTCRCEVGHGLHGATSRGNLAGPSPVEDFAWYAAKGNAILEPPTTRRRCRARPQGTLAGRHQFRQSRAGEKDPVTGEPGGISADIARELARRLTASRSNPSAMTRRARRWKGRRRRHGISAFSRSILCARPESLYHGLCRDRGRVHGRADVPHPRQRRRGSSGQARRRDRWQRLRSLPLARAASTRRSSARRTGA